MNRELDILANLELDSTPDEESIAQIEQIEEIFEHAPESFFHTASPVAEAQNTIEEQTESPQEAMSEVQQEETEEIVLKNPKQHVSLLSGTLFLVKYMCTSFLIFGVLMVASNYSAYGKLLYSIIYASELKQTQQSMVESVSAANIEVPVQENEHIHTFQALESQTPHETPHDAPNIHSLTKLISQTESKEIDLGIEITPYDNRVVIPKIGKNIPLIDIENREISGVDELNDIFMDELEDGIIRYPGSSLPGQKGNSFIFGHSSNFPWMQGEYNDVFALLDKLSDGDEIIVYYNQEKYTYVVSKKDVIRPGDVSVLKNTDKEKRELNLMTCWPIGTTLNRLVVSANLSSVEKQ